MAVPIGRSGAIDCLGQWASGRNRMNTAAERPGMKRATLLLTMIFLTGAGLCRGQVGGNIAYAQAGAKARAEQAEQASASSPTATSADGHEHVRRGRAS